MELVSVVNGIGVLLGIGYIEISSFSATTKKGELDIHTIGGDFYVFPTYLSIQCNNLKRRFL